MANDDKLAAQGIVEKIIKDCVTFNASTTIDALVSQGVTGELLKETIRILERCGFLVDSRPETALKQIVDKNISNCRKALKFGPDAAMDAEIEMLQVVKIALGVCLDRATIRKYQEADTSHSLILKRFEFSDARLFEFIENSDDSLIDTESGVLAIIKPTQDIN